MKNDIFVSDVLAYAKREVCVIEIIVKKKRLQISAHRLTLSTYRLTLDPPADVMRNPSNTGIVRVTCRYIVISNTNILWKESKST